MNSEEKGLNPKQAQFVAEYFRNGGNQARAAVLAGYSASNAKEAGYALMQIPAVKAAIDEARKGWAEKAGYNLEAAMQEAQDAILFAELTENANAYVKAVELRSKLNGLLVEKIDVRQSGFQINILRRDGPCRYCGKADEEREPDPRPTPDETAKALEHKKLEEALEREAPGGDRTS